jgi:hypothetical protein
MYCVVRRRMNKTSRTNADYSDKQRSPAGRDNATFSPLGLGMLNGCHARTPVYPRMSMSRKHCGHLLEFVCDDVNGSNRSIAVAEIFAITMRSLWSLMICDTKATPTFMCSSWWGNLSKVVRDRPTPRECSPSLKSPVPRW